MNLHRNHESENDAPRVFGAYRLLRELPSGDGGAVHFAQCERDGGERVVRILPPEFAKNSLVVRSFAASMRAAQKARHENLVPVLEFGSKDGLLYAAEESSAGESLSELITRAERVERSVPTSAAVSIALQLLAGLDALEHTPSDDGPAARSRGESPRRPLALGPSPHTEICPENVFVTRHGVLRITKLGATRWALSADALGLPLGVPGYSAPEVHEAPFGANAAADVFSVGAILAELLTGRRLFTRATKLGTLVANHGADLRNLWECSKEVPPELAALLTGALVRDPQARYDSAAAFATALREASPLLGADLATDVTRWMFDIGGLQKKSGQHAIGTSRLGLVPPAEEPARPLGLGAGTDDGQLAVSAEYIATGRSFVNSNLSARSKLSLRHMAASRTYRFGESVEARAAWARPFIRERLPKTLFRLASIGATGLLLFRTGNVEKRVYYESGIPRAFASTLRDDLFGARLTREGVLSMSEVDTCVARAARSGLRLGEALVESGTLPASVVLNQLLRHQEESFLKLGTWQGGVMAFVDQECPDAKLPLTLRPHAAQIAELVRRSYSAQELAALFATRPDTKLRLAKTAPFTPDELALRPVERLWLERAADGRCVRDLLSAMDTAAASDALSALAIGVSAGLLEGTSFSNA